MKQLRVLPVFIFLFFVAISCREDEPEPTPVPDKTNPESIELFLDGLQGQSFRMSRLQLVDSVRIGEKCPFGDVRCDTVYYTDLQEAKRDCRKDDIYLFDYRNGSLFGSIDDASQICDTQEVSNSQAFIVELNDSRLAGELTFELDGNTAVNRFFGFYLESPGASVFYDMVWNFSHLGADSINIMGEFKSGYLPDVTIQFRPI
ncbi:MAG: hypothetical protein AAF632_18685 [Bacteroidota bacterium]